MGCFVFVVWFSVRKISTIADLPRKETTEKRIAPVTARIESSRQESHENDVDTDNDGLKDWEEKIYGTDPKKPDTDSDGTPDGEEIRLRRNPLKPPPDEILSTAFQEKEPAVEKNLTQRMVEAVGKAYIEQKRNGQPGVKFDAKTVAAKAFNELDYTPPETTKITLKDLHISHDESPDAVRAYLNRLGDVFSQDVYPPSQPKPLELALDIMKKKRSEKETTGFDLYIDIAKRTIQKLISMPVPYSWTKEHTELATASFGALNSLYAMRNLETDPVNAIMVIQPYINTQLSFWKIFFSIRKKIEDRHIVLDPGDQLPKLFAVMESTQPAIFKSTQP